MDLQEYLQEYKTITLSLMNPNIDSDQMNSFINRRSEILNILNSSNFDKEEIKKIGYSLDLLSLEDEVQNSMKKEMVKIKKELARLKKIKQANMQYNHLENKARVFSKSV